MLFKLKEVAEEREDVWLIGIKGEINEKLLKEEYKQNKKQAKLLKRINQLRELQISGQYNLRYHEEKENYLRELEVKKARYNLLNYC